MNNNCNALVGPAAAMYGYGVGAAMAATAVVVDEEEDIKLFVSRNFWVLQEKGEAGIV